MDMVGPEVDPGWTPYIDSVGPTGATPYMDMVAPGEGVGVWGWTPNMDIVGTVVKKHAYVKHILLECPFTTELFQKNGCDLNAYNNVRDILYNTDVITNIGKSIVHNPVGKLV